MPKFFRITPEFTSSGKGGFLVYDDANRIDAGLAAASSGKHIAGMWRTSATAPGASPDGSTSYEYSAPQGDECMIILEGNATVTVQATGEKYDLTPGTIVIQPKDLSVTWDIAAPYLKKFLVIWDSPNSVSHDPLTELIIGPVNDNPLVAGWEPYWPNGPA